MRLLILLLSVATLAGCASSAPPAPASPPPRAALETRSPEDVAASFVAALQRRDTTAAWDSFSAAFRERLGADEFQPVVEEWLKDPQVQWELPAREVVPDGTLESPLRLKVRLNRSAARPEWTLVLVEGEDGSWKIDDWKGGPIR